MAKDNAGGAAPAWAIPAAIVVLVIVIGVIAWKTLGSNSSGSDAPPVAVKPGMFDFKKEASSGKLGGGLKTMPANGSGN